MSSLRPEDRVSLCKFMFADGRRCRTPRLAGHPNFCYYHAQKESRASAATKLGEDLAFFFSGDYLSANDLAAALGRILPAVIRGDIQPCLARTVAYYAQTLIQTIHLAQNEYIRACGERDWRKSICDSLNQNFDYRRPPAPEPPGADSGAAPVAISPQPDNQSSPVGPATAVILGAAQNSGPSREDRAMNPDTTPPDVEAGLQPGSSSSSNLDVGRTHPQSQPPASEPVIVNAAKDHGVISPAAQSPSSAPNVPALGPAIVADAVAVPPRLSPPRRHPAPKTALESTLTGKPVTVDSK